MQLFRKFISTILLQEAKADDVAKRYPDVPRELIDELNEADPSPTKKYLQWMVKQVDAGFASSDIIPSIQFFHQSPNKFTKRDINQYRDVKELEDEVKKASEKVSSTEQRKQVKALGAAKIYEDEKITVVRIDTKQAAMAYGAGTKWCITMAGHTYYEQYKRSNVIFHFILRKNPIGDKFDKIAAATSRYKDNQINQVEYFDVEDKSYGENFIIDIVFVEKFDINSRDAEQILRKMEHNAVAQPKAFLAKLKSNEPVTDQEIKEYWMNLNSLPDADSRRLAQWTFFGYVPEEQRKNMISYVDDVLRDALENGGDFDRYEDAVVYRNENGSKHRVGGPAIIRKSGNKEWYQRNELHREDGPAIEHWDGGKEWYFNGNRHRVGGPAIEHTNGDKEWLQFGQRHREDGPAVELDGEKEWWVEGSRHREDGPAIESANGDKEWYFEGRHHRLDGPAVICKNERKWYKFGKKHRIGGPAIEDTWGKEWWVEGSRHREDGPAIISSDGVKEWCLNDEFYSEKEYYHELQRLQKR